MGSFHIKFRSTVQSSSYLLLVSCTNRFTLDVDKTLERKIYIHLYKHIWAIIDASVNKSFFNGHQVIIAVHRLI